jgi:hypothetical protein
MTQSPIPQGQPEPEPPSNVQAATALTALALAAQQIFSRRPQPERQQNQSGGALSLWLLGLIPVLLACLHLMIVARGDAETLRSLTQNLNITALVLSTTLPLGTTILTWIYFFTLVIALTKPKGERLKGVRKFLWFLVVIVVIDVIAMPANYGAVNLTLFSVFAGSAAVSRSVNKRPHGARFERALKALSQANARFWATALLLGPLLVWLCFLGVYLPKERLVIGSTHLEPVYILSIDDRWTKYMDSAHKVHIAPTPQVRGRETVGTADSFWRKTPLSLLGTWWTHPTQPAPKLPGPQPQSPLPKPTKTGSSMTPDPSVAPTTR